ncbi:MAG: hypothetical protein MZW92_00255 [Comamonadaceae bacterium]|nr:hypothetical protein [Comamonadaceae bacterium]
MATTQGTDYLVIGAGASWPGLRRRVVHALTGDDAHIVAGRTARHAPGRPLERRPTRSCACTSRPPTTASIRASWAHGAIRTRRARTPAHVRPVRVGPELRGLLPRGAARAAAALGTGDVRALVRRGARPRRQRARCATLLSGQRDTVRVRRKVVDASAGTRDAIPRTHAHKCSVAPGIACVPPNDLPLLAPRHRRYAVLGGGKTAIDACRLWLLDNGAPADAITWVIPRDSRFFNRAKVQAAMPFGEQAVHRHRRAARGGPAAARARWTTWRCAWRPAVPGCGSTRRSRRASATTPRLPRASWRCCAASATWCPGPRARDRAGLSADGPGRGAARYRTDAVHRRHRERADQAADQAGVRGRPHHVADDPHPAADLQRGMHRLRRGHDAGAGRRPAQPLCRADPDA